MSVTLRGVKKLFRYLGNKPEVTVTYEDNAERWKLRGQLVFCDIIGETPKPGEVELYSVRLTFKLESGKLMSKYLTIPSDGKFDGFKSIQWTNGRLLWKWTTGRCSHGT